MGHLGIDSLVGAGASHTVAEGFSLAAASARPLNACSLAPCCFVALSTKARLFGGSVCLNNCTMCPAFRREQLGIKALVFGGENENWPAPQASAAVTVLPGALQLCRLVVTAALKALGRGWQARPQKHSGVAFGDRLALRRRPCPGRAADCCSLLTPTRGRYP